MEHGSTQSYIASKHFKGNQQKKRKKEWENELT